MYRNRIFNFTVIFDSIYILFIILNIAYNIDIILYNIENSITILII